MPKLSGMYVIPLNCYSNYCIRFLMFANVKSISADVYGCAGQFISIWEMDQRTFRQERNCCWWVLQTLLRAPSTSV